MPSELVGALVMLVTVCTFLAFTILYKLWNGDFDNKVKTVTAKAEDNIFTKAAAEQQRRAAEANQKAAEATLRAEEVRLERVRLEKTS